MNYFVCFFAIRLKKKSVGTWWVSINAVRRVFELTLEVSCLEIHFRHCGIKTSLTATLKYSHEVRGEF